MKKLLLLLIVATGVAFTACGGGEREESDNKDSIDAARSADSMIQDQLNADTTMNTDSTTDNMPTDSMQKNGNKR